MKKQWFIQLNTEQFLKLKIGLMCRYQNEIESKTITYDEKNNTLTLYVHAGNIHEKIEKNISCYLSGFSQAIY